MNTQSSEKLHSEGLISSASLSRLKKAEAGQLFTVYWELKALLYIGILLLTGGLGILVYKNIDKIGHQLVLAVIAAISIASFVYCERKKPPFSTGKVLAPDTYFDYVLLLGCLTLLTSIAYLQFQYNVFGEAYGLATFIPMVMLFFCAYYFDHLGILSLAIANLAAWMGIAVTPLTILKANNFGDGELIFTALLLGVFLTVASMFSERRNIKKHFSFTYLNFGMNILFIATLAGMFYFYKWYFLWLLPLGSFAFFFYKKAIALSSFHFIVLIVLYTYVGAAQAVGNIIEISELTLMYCIGTGIYAITLLIKLHKHMKRHASL